MLDEQIPPQFSVFLLSSRALSRIDDQSERVRHVLCLEPPPHGRVMQMRFFVRGQIAPCPEGEPFAGTQSHHVALQMTEAATGIRIESAPTPTTPAMSLAIGDKECLS